MIFLFKGTVSSEIDKLQKIQSNLLQERKSVHLLSTMQRCLMDLIDQLPIPHELDILQLKYFESLFSLQNCEHYNRVDV